MKPYQNIVSDKIVSYNSFYVIADYDTKEEAEANFKRDVDNWKRENRGKDWYKNHYPFAYASIYDPGCK